MEFEMFNELNSKEELNEYKKLNEVFNFLDLSKILNDEFFASFSYIEKINPEYFYSQIEKQLLYNHDVNPTKTKKMINTFVSERLGSEEQFRGNHNFQQILSSFLEDLTEAEVGRASNKEVRVYEDIFKIERNNIISLNNFLFIQQEAVLNSAPFKKTSQSRNEELEKFNRTHNPWMSEELLKLTSKFELSDNNFYNLSKPDEFFFENPEDYDDEEFKQYSEDYNDFINSEVNRWCNYLSIYVAGNVSTSVIIFLERFLTEITTFCVQNNLGKATFYKDRRISILDGRIKHLREEFNLKFEIPKELSEIILNTRIARNQFAHGNWKEGEKFVLPYSSSQMINVVYTFVCIICLAVQKRLN